MEVPDERGIQNTTPGNPGALLRTVPHPVDEVLVSQAAASYLQKEMDCPWVAGWLSMTLGGGEGGAGGDNVWDERD